MATIVVACLHGVVLTLRESVSHTHSTRGEEGQALGPGDSCLGLVTIQREILSCHCVPTAWMPRQPHRGQRLRCAELGAYLSCDYPG